MYACGYIRELRPTSHGSYMMPPVRSRLGLMAINEESHTPPEVCPRAFGAKLSTSRTVSVIWTSFYGNGRPHGESGVECQPPTGPAASQPTSQPNSQLADHQLDQQPAGQPSKPPDRPTAKQASSQTASQPGSPTQQKVQPSATCHPHVASNQPPTHHHSLTQMSATEA